MSVQSFIFLLFLSSVTSATQECLKLLCDTEAGNCHPCTGLSADQLATWRRYIDILLNSFTGDEGGAPYYRQIRDTPNCCSIGRAGRCFIRLIDEPRLPPYRLYELGCRSQQNFWNPMSLELPNERSCNSSFCNLPRKEEFAKLNVEAPKDKTLIVIVPVCIGLIILVFIGGLCYWCCRDRKSEWRKTSQLPGTVTTGGCLNELGPTYTPLGDSLPWHTLETATNGVPVTTSAAGPFETAGVPTIITVANATASSMASNGAVGTTLTDSVPPLYPSRAPLLPYGGGGASISSSIVGCRPLRGLPGPHSYMTGPVATSIGPGGGGGGGSTMIGASYTAASIGGSLLPTSNSAPPGAGGIIDMTSSGSGSGAGQPLLVERTVARQVTLNALIGEGRYGKVWLGRLHGDQVAVKIFTSRNENSWIREKEIYETATLRHSNILGFIAADNKDNGISTELWLIAEYHRLGSLYEFLQVHAFTLPALVKMASSIANGLAHLHRAIVGTSGKPQIAHRDLKTRNILVKLDGECCIGDLGFAVKYDSLTGSVDLGRSTELVGTKRYMAPEVLDNKLCVDSFDAYKHADIYSLGLVYWEMTRRVYVPGIYGPEEYQLPYQDNVGPDPQIEEMKSVVCELGIRPHLPLQWQTDSSLCRLYEIMTECWSANPSNRLSAMRIKKDLANLRQHLGQPRHPSDISLPPHILRQQPSSLDALPPGVFVYRSSSSGGGGGEEEEEEGRAQAARGADDEDENTASSTVVVSPSAYKPTSQVRVDVETEEAALLASGGPTLQPPNVVATASTTGGNPKVVNPMA